MKREKRGSLLLSKAALAGLDVGRRQRFSQPPFGLLQALARAMRVVQRARETAASFSLAGVSTNANREEEAAFSRTPISFSVFSSPPPFEKKKKEKESERQRHSPNRPGTRRKNLTLFVLLFFLFALSLSLSCVSRTESKLVFVL